MIGKKIAHYQITEIVSEQPDGGVYRAKDLHLNRIVAIKAIKPSRRDAEAAGRRFMREAQAISQIDHPNVITLFDVVEDADFKYLVMQYVPGLTLRETMRRRALTPVEAMRIACEVADGLEAAHRLGVIHRDIKPDNVMISESGLCKILDFGVAHLADRSTLTRRGKIVGTLPYMAPEQIRSEPVDQRTDVYSFGVLVFEMVTGRLPFERTEEAALFYEILNCDPPRIGLLRPEFPKEIESIVSRALSKSPGDRFSTMAELRQELKKVCERLEERRAPEDVSQESPADDSAPRAGSDPMVAERVSHYEIIERLGEGGMGVVYKALDLKLNRYVALKFLPQRLISDRTAKERFIQEAKAASALDHPNIATMYEIDETADGRLFIAMGFYEGRTLKEMIEGGPLEIDTVIGVISEIASGLAKAHEHGIIHRDIKPANILFSNEGQVKILDFGLAKLIGDTKLTQTGVTVGTVTYMSPEQARGGELDPRSDLFSVGLVLYELLTGTPAFRGDYDAAVAYGIAAVEPERLSKCRTELSETDQKRIQGILDRLLAKDPEDRYATAKDLLEALAPFRKSAARARLGNGAGGRRRLRRALAFGGPALAGLLIVLLLAVPRSRLTVKSLLGLSLLPENKNVGVLPLRTSSSDPEAIALGAGITDVLQTALLRMTAGGQVQVTRPVDWRVDGVSRVAEAREELGINLAVAGSLGEPGTSYEATIELLDAAKGWRLRTESIEVPRTDVLALVEGIVDGVVDMLDIEIDEEGRQALRRYGTEDHAAFNFYLLGVGYLQLPDRAPDIERAITHFETAFKLDPNFALAPAGLGWAYWLKFGETADTTWLEKAGEACRQALDCDAMTSEAHFWLGKIHHESGREAEAAVEFERAANLDPTNNDALLELGKTYGRLGRAKETERTYRRAVDERPDYWVGYFWLGHHYYRSGNDALAAEMWERMVVLGPTYRAYRTLGGIYVELGRHEAAVNTLEKSIALKPNGYAYGNLGTAYFNLREFEKAVRAYKSAIQVRYDELRNWGNLGDACVRVRRQVEAKKAYEEAVKLGLAELQKHKDDAYLLGYLAELHAKLAKRDPALEYLAAAFRLTPSDPELQYVAMKVYNELGDKQSALDWLEKALASGYPPDRVLNTPESDGLRAEPRFQQLIRGGEHH